MLCPQCKCEMMIGSTRYVTKNDDTAERQTKLFVEQDMTCRNSKCSNNGKIVSTVRNEIPLSPPQGVEDNSQE